MKRWMLFLAVLALMAAACGGSDDADESGADPAVTTTQLDTGDETGEEEEAPSETSAPDAESEEDVGASEGSGPSTATVTLGEETYNFSTEGALVAQCQTDMFGIFSVQLPMIDDSGAQAEGGVSIVALLEGTDPATVGEVNSIEVSVGDEDWVADEADDLYEQSDLLEPGMSQVDSVEVDGSTVRGTATFVRQNSLFGGGEAETLTGTFEATCGEERLS